MSHITSSWQCVLITLYNILKFPEECKIQRNFEMGYNLEVAFSSQPNFKIWRLSSKVLNKVKTTVQLFQPFPTPMLFFSLTTTEMQSIPKYYSDKFFLAICPLEPPPPSVQKRNNLRVKCASLKNRKIYRDNTGFFFPFLLREPPRNMKVGMSKRIDMSFTGLSLFPLSMWTKSTLFTILPSFLKSDQ